MAPAPIERPRRLIYVKRDHQKANILSWGLAMEDLHENDLESGGNYNLDRRLCDVVVVWLV